jgi:hypothetical protein
LIEKPISEMPDALLAHASQRTGWYSTTLIKVSPPNDPLEEVIQAGSGTLVRLGEVFGVLTAHHVAELFDGSWHLGLVLRPETHRHAIMPELFDVVPIARGEFDSEGPDISFIRIYPPHVGVIRAYKSFYNLEAYRNAMLSNPPAPETGAWFIWGVPSEKTSWDEPEGGFQGVIFFQGDCGATAVDKQFSVGEFDYLDMAVEYTQTADIVRSFKGYSGGGIWHALLAQDADGGIDDYEYILSGVTFYQSAIEDNFRTIRGHGPNSIYDIAYEAIRSKYA